MAKNRTLEPKQLVLDRLELVSIISSLNPLFLNPELVRDTPNGGWTHPWLYFDALRNYLLLTCFDLLGQSHSFKDFQSWLSATSTKEKRTTALIRAETETELVEAIKVVHRAYLADYGTKKSFYRFIREVLPKSVRDELLFGVRIREIDPVRNLEVGLIETEDKKIEFLYSVRNSYTHAGANIGSPGGGVFERKWLDFGKGGWMPIHYVERDKLRIEYSVRDWPDALIQVVHTGLSLIPM